MSALKLVKLAMLTALAALSSAATPVHHVRFSQPSMILVWQDGALIGQGDEIALSGFGAVSPGDLLGSGTLMRAGEAAVRTQTVTIASNARFEIRAQIPLEPDRVTVRVIHVGENAQAQIHAAGLSPQTVFQQSAKTASRPGDPLSQALTLEIEWSGDAVPDLYVAAL